MARGRWGGMLLLWACMLAMSGAQEAPVTEIPVVPGPFTLDGKLDEGAWAQATTLHDFIIVRTTRHTPAATAVRLLADATSLYIGWRCEDRDPARLVQTTAGPNAPIWNDDAVEVFLDPGHAFVSLIQLGVSNTAATFTQGSGVLYGRLPQDFGLEATTFVGDAFWSVEMRLPLARVGLSYAAYAREDAPPFTMSFARDLRNPAYAEGDTTRLDMNLSGLPYFDRKGFRRFRFAGSAPAVRISGGEHDAIANARECALTLRNTGKAAVTLSYRWARLAASTAPPMALTLPAGGTKALRLTIQEFRGGAHLYRLAMSLPDGRAFVHDLCFALTEGVEIAPDFPCRATDGGDKTLRLLPAPYVRAKGHPYRLQAAVLSHGVPVWQQSFAKLSPEIRVPFTKPFAALPDGSYTLHVTLQDGARVVYATAYDFHKGSTALTLPTGRPVPLNGDFEATTARRPANWDERDPHTPAAVYPADWYPAKPPAWWRWGNLQTDPRSVYEGARSIVLQGRWPGAEMHLASRAFTVNRHATYQIRLVARGTGLLACRYYLRNAQNQWLSRYFDTRQIPLTDMWTEYVFDPADLDTEIHHGWDGNEVADPLPAQAQLIISVPHDGLAYVDNVLLIEVPK